MKETDPETALNYTALRRAVLDGRLPCVYSGRKRLIALEDLEDFCSGGCSAPSAAVGTIRRVQ